MRIQHNLAAMNANRNLRKNTGSIKKNLEKLSSGYRINRSADDAAGLSISEKMRASISGLDQAEDNVADGISLVQTADGAMQEIHDMLTRLTTLSAQASNGTLTDQEREAIQEEVDHLLDEIVRIKDSTNFNDIPLLQGEDGTIFVKPMIKGQLPDWVTTVGGNSLSTTYETQENYVITTTTTNPDGTTTSTDSPEASTTVKHAAATVDFSNLTSSNVSDLLKEDSGFYSTCCTCSEHYSIKFVSGTGYDLEKSGDHNIFKIGIDGISTGEELVNRILTATGGNPGNHYTMFTAAPGDPDKLIIYDDRAMDSSYEPTLTQDQTVTYSTSWKYHNQIAYPRPSSGYGLFGEGIAYDKKALGIGDIDLQIGEFGEDFDRLAVDLPDMNLANLGISGLDVTTAEKAQRAISRIRSAVDYVSGERARMGAYQNRLEHTREHLGSSVENLTDSESTIRDADMAEEMMTYTKNNILTQSAQAMLAQANQVPQGVLQLMQ